MNGIFDRFIRERHHLVIEEEDMIRVLTVLQKHHYRLPPDNMAVGNCGWADDTKKWFIHFDTTRAKWNLIVNELNVIRVFGNCNIPTNTLGFVYTTD